MAEPLSLDAIEATIDGGWPNSDMLAELVLYESDELREQEAAAAEAGVAVSEVDDSILIIDGVLANYVRNRDRVKTAVFHGLANTEVRL